MFEFSTDPYVYKFKDLASNSIEYISIEVLTNCDWRVRDEIPASMIATAIKEKSNQIKIVSKNAKSQNNSS